MPGSGRRFPISSVAATSSVAGIRSSDSLSHDAIPSTAAMRSADRSASSSECTCAPPLCMTARRNSPLAVGVPSNVATLKAPADSPKIVTLSRIAAEGRDVVAHPREGGHLVVDAPIADEPVRVDQVRGDPGTPARRAGS